MGELTRRELLRRLATLACATTVPRLLAGCAPAPQPTTPPAASTPGASPSAPLPPTAALQPTPIPAAPEATAVPAHLAVAHGSEPVQIVERAIATLGGKNLLGVVAEPGALHRNIGQRVAELVSLIRPALTVIDAVRIMVRNGPTGGSLDDLQRTNTVIASPDIVAADAYATRLFGRKPADIAYIKASATMGLGVMDLDGVKVEELEVG